MATQKYYIRGFSLSASNIHSCMFLKIRSVVQKYLKFVLWNLHMHFCINQQDFRNIHGRKRHLPHAWKEGITAVAWVAVYNIKWTHNSLMLFCICMKLVKQTHELYVFILYCSIAYLARLDSLVYAVPAIVRLYITFFLLICDKIPAYVTRSPKSNPG